jgi:hypothetical protein
MPYEQAQQRKEADQSDYKMARLRKEGPDLTDQVIQEKLALLETMKASSPEKHQEKSRPPMKGSWHRRFI